MTLCASVSQCASQGTSVCVELVLYYDVVIEEVRLEGLLEERANVIVILQNNNFLSMENPFFKCINREFLNSPFSKVSTVKPAHLFVILLVLPHPHSSHSKTPTLLQNLGEIW